MKDKLHRNQSNTCARRFPPRLTGEVDFHFTNGTGKKMVNAIPPGIADRPKTEKIKYDFNLALAKDLLKKAGYPEGQGTASNQI